MSGQTTFEVPSRRVKDNGLDFENTIGFQTSGDGMVDISVNDKDGFCVRVRIGIAHLEQAVAVMLSGQKRFGV